MNALLAGLCAGAAVHLLGRGTPPRRVVLHGLAPRAHPVPAEAGRTGRPTGLRAMAGRTGGPTGASSLGRRAAAAMAGLAAVLLVGGVSGLVVGGVLGAGLHRWLGGLEPRAVRERRQRLEADLPVAADLLAACLGAGCSFEAATGAVADAVGGPLSEVLRASIASLRLGADPVQCWRSLERDAALAPFGRTLARAAASGAPVADAVSHLAQEQRRERRWSADAAARRVGVQAVAPLGLCFLPAFTLLAVVPMVAGLAATVLPGLR